MATPFRSDDETTDKSSPLALHSAFSVRLSGENPFFFLLKREPSQAIFNPLATALDWVAEDFVRKAAADCQPSDPIGELFPGWDFSDTKTVGVAFGEFFWNRISGKAECV